MVREENIDKSEERLEKKRKNPPKQLAMLKENKDFTFRSGFIQEAQSAGVDFFSLEMFVYHELRFMEVEGPSKAGYCFAGYDWYVQKLEGVAESAIKEAFKRLQNKGLVVHVFCDKKIYRGKTKLWISTARLGKALNTKQAIESVRILSRGLCNQKILAGDPEEGIFKFVDRPETGFQNPETGFQNPESGVQNPEINKTPPQEAIGVGKNSYVPSKYQVSTNIYKKKDKSSCKASRDSKATDQSVETNGLIKQTNLIKKRDSSKAFIPPTVEEVKAYCIEKQYQVDPETFVGYYAENSWHDSNNKPVKNWKQRLFTWEKNLKRNNSLLPSITNSGAIGTEIISQKSRAFRLWEEVMRVEMTPTKENYEAGEWLLETYGEEKLRELLICSLEVKTDRTAGWWARHISNYAMLLKHRDEVLDWAREKAKLKADMKKHHF